MRPNRWDEMIDGPCVVCGQPARFYQNGVRALTCGLKACVATLRVRNRNRADPTLEEIRAQTAAIRQTWSADEYEERAVLRREEWQPRGSDCVQ